MINKIPNVLHSVSFNGNNYRITDGDDKDIFRCDLQINNPHIPVWITIKSFYATSEEDELQDIFSKAQELLNHIIE